jgi:glycosyltransferase involved in cell wall biosynthesis
VATPRQPLISIITVVLNGAHTLEKTIKSVFHQKFRDFEYIIIDGGSEDGSIEIIKKYESKLTCWISEPDDGVYDAMNKAVSLITGKWVYFLGADDQLLDGFERAIKLLKDEKTIYYGNVYRPVVDRIYDGEFSAYKLACRNICHQSIFYPRYVWDKYSFDLKYPIFADYELNLKCFGDADIKFKYIPVTIAIFSDEGGISRTRGDVSFEKAKLSIIKGIFPFWIYILIFMRSFFVKILAQLRLQKASIKIYHYFLRAKSIYSAEKKTITKKYYRNKE